MGVLIGTALIAVFCYGFLSAMASGMVEVYVESKGLSLSEWDWMDISFGIQGISLISSVILFAILFLFLTGDRLSYIGDIIKGIDALGHHQWDYRVPVEGNNELTELAERINILSFEEQMLREKEARMQQEKDSFVRGLSHDIRTPLTSILSYSEYMKTKKEISQEEIREYILLMEQKAGQIKMLTDRLLDPKALEPEMIEDGKFLMQQLTEEWMTELEDDFTCVLDLSQCPVFSGCFDVQELRRIFDNLASNIKKYASDQSEIYLSILQKEGQLLIRQWNLCKPEEERGKVESTKLGIESIRKIADSYGGTVEVVLSETQFVIEITLAVHL